MSEEKPLQFPPLLPDEEIDRMVVRKPRPPGSRPQPFAIVQQSYPRVAERLKQVWGTGECDRYFAELLIDTRGNRQGFPPAVVSALLELSEEHQRRSGAPLSAIDQLSDVNRRAAR